MPKPGHNTVPNKQGDYPESKQLTRKPKRSATSLLEVAPMARSLVASLRNTSCVATMKVPSWSACTCTNMCLAASTFLTTGATPAQSRSFSKAMPSTAFAPSCPNSLHSHTFRREMMMPSNNVPSQSRSSALIQPQQQQYFHSSPLLRKKRKNKWKSVRLYAEERDKALREALGDDYDDMNQRKRNKSRSEIEHVSESENPTEEEEQDSTEPVHYGYDPSDDIVRSQSLDWIQRIVIGLNFCPFAASPLSSDKLAIEVVRGDDAETIAAAVLLELILRVDKPGTTVVVAPECHPDDFETYLDIVDFIDGTLMTEHELVGKVQLAPFHPLFRFGDGDSDSDSDNSNIIEQEGEVPVDAYTNRSPYPMFHVLREEEVGAAADRLGGKPEKVWQRNVKVLEMMEERFGRSKVEDIIACRLLVDEDASVKDPIESILKQAKVEMEDE